MNSGTGAIDSKKSEELPDLQQVAVTVERITSNVVIWSARLTVRI